MNCTGLMGSRCGVLIILLVLQLIGDGLDNPRGLASAGTGGGCDEARFQV